MKASQEHVRFLGFLIHSFLKRHEKWKASLTNTFLKLLIKINENSLTVLSELEATSIASTIPVAVFALNKCIGILGS